MYNKELGIVFISKNKNFVNELCGGVNDSRVVPLSLISSTKNMESSLRCLQPELIVIDDTFTEITAARLAQRISVIKFYVRPMIFVLSGKSNSEYIELCASAGITYYMLKPLISDIFWDRAFMLFNEQQLMAAECRIQSKMKGGLSREEAIDREAMKLLYRLGCQPKTKGFLYLKEAVSYLAKNQNRMNIRGRALYEAIGNKFHQSWMNIQRNIGIAIKSVDMNLTKELFYGSEKELSDERKPFSGMEFIYLAAYLVCETIDRHEEENYSEEC